MTAETTSPLPGGSPRTGLAGGLTALGMVLTVAVLWLGILVHLHQVRESELAQARRDVSNLSIALAEQVARLLEGTDQVMRLIQSDYAADPAGFDLAVWIRRSILLHTAATQITVFDANGDYVASRDPITAAPRPQVRDRGYFRALAELPGAGLHVGRTLRGRITGRWSLQLARRLDRPDGSFGGILVVSLSPDFIAERFRALDVGPHGSVALFGRDGYVRARWPEQPAMYDIDAATLTPAPRVLEDMKRAPSGTYVAAGDGIDRIVGYRTVEGLPLAVTVGKATDDVLAPVAAQRRDTLVLGGAGTLLILTFGASLIRELRRRARREDLLVRAHRDLGSSEARYRLLADHATDMIVQLDLDGRRLFVSPAARSLLGYAPEELVGTRPQDGVHPDDAARLDDTMVRLVRGEAEAAMSTHRLAHKSGAWIWVEGSWCLVRDAEGRPAGFVASVRPIEARRRAEEAQRIGEAKYRALADTLPQLVWLTRAADGEATYLNRQFEDYYGPIGRLWEERVARNHPDDAVRMEAEWRRAAASGTAFEVEGRLQRHDGVYRWHKLVILPLRYGDSVIGWLGTALDIDEIIAARRALEESSTLLRLAQDGAGAGAWDLDLRGGTLVLSPGSAHLHGLPGDAEARMTLDGWRRLVPPEDADRMVAAMQEAIASRETFRGEFRVIAPDGGARWIQGVARTEYDTAGTAIRMIGLNFDGTARKQAEDALVQAKAAAEAARIEAERASAAKTDFLAAMSHEIRTPLNATIGFTDLLVQSGRLAPDLQNYAELAHTAGEALLSVVNDILEFSRVEAGAVELTTESFSLRSLAESSVAIIRDQAGAKGLELSIDLDPTLPAALVGDAGRLRQILFNLLNNAVKFTAAGSITLEIRCEALDGAGAHLHVGVSDTGIGIAPEKQHRLFQRFSQADGAIQRDYGGTGLGLAISRRFVELMGGRIGVVSEAGRGATFWFTLVLPLAEAAPVRQADSALPARAGGRLLLAEDVAINQELARVVLEAAGHSVDIVGDGAAAIRAVETGSYDLVLMDVQMPILDGPGAVREIRALDSRAARIPIIAMTANVLPEEIRRCREAGMDDHVGKPFNRPALYRTIERWLEIGAERASAADPRPALVDDEVFAEFVGMVGPSRACSLLRRFRDDLALPFPGSCTTPEGRARMRAAAHAQISSAGTVGFAALAAACQRLEALDEVSGGEPAGSTDGPADFIEAAAAVAALRGPTAQAADRLADSLALPDVAPGSLRPARHRAR